MRPFAAYGEKHENKPTRCFTDIHPIKAILLACLPTLSISWGWIVLLRSLFRRSEFCR